MPNDPSVPRPESSGATLDFDQLRAELDSLNVEIRQDTAQSLTADAVLERLSLHQQRLSQLVRHWRSKPGSISPSSLSSAERILPAIYEVLEDDLPRFPSLWADYRVARPSVEEFYGIAMDAISVFTEVLNTYREQGFESRPLGQVGSDARDMATYRREMITAVSYFQQKIEAVLEALGVSGQHEAVE
jgi:hypothetical protein